MIIATFELPRDMYEYILEAVTEKDVQGFNEEFGLSYTQEQFAYIAPTVSLIDDTLKHFYGRAVVFKAREFKARWVGEGERAVIHIEVEVHYAPFLVPN